MKTKSILFSVVSGSILLIELSLVQNVMVWSGSFSTAIFAVAYKRISD
jgi:hypothetical protein